MGSAGMGNDLYDLFWWSFFEAIEMAVSRHKVYMGAFEAFFCT